MNKLKFFSTLTLTAFLAACGGGADRKTPDVTVPTIAPTPTPDPNQSQTFPHVPFAETFTASDTVGFFSADYKGLGGDFGSEEDQFYFSTGGVYTAEGELDSNGGNWITADNDQAMRLGNARFSIAQTVLSSGGAVRTKTSTDADTTTWGEMDLSQDFRLSFCVVESSGADSGSSLFQLYLDNNSTSSTGSIHGGLSRLVSTPTSGFVAGKRVVIDVPGDIVLAEDGNAVASVATNVGTETSFLQLRVSSGGYIVLDDMVIEYQSDISLGDAQTGCAAKTTAYATENPFVEATPPPAATPTPEPTPVPSPTATPVPGEVTWSSYNSDLKPLDAGSLNDGGTSTEFEEGNDANPIAGYWTVADGIGTFASPTGADKPYADFGPIVGETFPKTFTMVTRLANPTTASKSFEIEMAFSGTDGAGNAGRLKFMLRDTKVDFEKFGAGSVEDATSTWSFPDGFDVTQFHDYQVTVTLQSARQADIALYVDGDPTPVHTDSTTVLRATGEDRNEIRIGENGSSAYDARIDWIIWTSDDAFDPSQLTGKLPSGLGDISNYEGADTTSPAADAVWSTYNSDLKPLDAGSLNDGGTSTEFEEGNDANPIAGYWTVADGIGTFASPTGADKPYADFGPIVGETFPKTFTMVTRLANPTTASKSFEVEMAFSGTDGAGNAGRLKFMLRDTKVDFEKFGAGSVEDATSTWSFPDGFDVTQFHDYQVTVTLQSAREADITLYVDGDATPVHTDSTTVLRATGEQRNEIRIGENGSSAYDARIDWIIWSDDGAFTAADLKGQLPSGLGDTSNYQ